MKVAIVHDDLMRRGGAEKVVKVISDMFPDAPIYTLSYREKLTYPEFKSRKVITSWFQLFSRSEFLMKWLFFPLGLMAMRSLKVNGYDLVIISTTYCAKYVRIDKRSKVVAYCYTPFRLAWNPKSYSIYSNAKGPLKWIFNIVIATLRKLDKSSTAKIHHFIAMTADTRDRILRAYEPKSPIPIINPSINTQNYSVSNSIKDYYLVVSRFEPYKKVDLVIEAFNVNSRKLIIVGNGSQESSLKAIAGPNIQFKQNLSNSELARIYEESKALIFPQHEDYGLVPIEANAAGRPVIAFGQGGILDTMIPYQDDPDNATCLFFDEQTISSLNSAVYQFETLKFEAQNAVKNAARFNDERFKSELTSFLNKVL